MVVEVIDADHYLHVGLAPKAGMIGTAQADAGIKVRQREFSIAAVEFDSRGIFRIFAKSNCPPAVSNRTRLAPVILSRTGTPSTCRLRLSIPLALVGTSWSRSGRQTRQPHLLDQTSEENAAACFASSKKRNAFKISSRTTFLPVLNPNGGEQVASKNYFKLRALKFAARPRHRWPRRWTISAYQPSDPDRPGDGRQLAH